MASHRSSGKKKVIIVADGQGIGIWEHLQRLFGDRYDVMSFIRSGAHFDAVVHDLLELIQSLSTRDHLVIIPGSGILVPPSIASLNTIKLAANTLTVTITKVPLRVDRTWMNYQINAFNAILVYELSSHWNICLCDVPILGRIKTFISGVQYTHDGKALLAQVIHSVLMSYSRNN